MRDGSLCSEIVLTRPPKWAIRAKTGTFWQKNGLFLSKTPHSAVRHVLVNIYGSRVGLSRAEGGAEGAALPPRNSRNRRRSCQERSTPIGNEEPKRPDPGGSRSSRDGELLPIIPLKDIVVFPDCIAPLFVMRPRSLSALEDAVSTDKRIFLVTQKSVDVENPSA